MGELVRYNAARQALADAATIDEVKQIADQAEALRHYARQRKDAQMSIWVAEIQLRAVRRIGQLSAELQKGHEIGTGQVLPAGGKYKAAALKEAGLSTSVAGRCEQVAAVPEERFEALIAEAEKAGRPITVNQVLKKGTKKEDQERKNARARSPFGEAGRTLRAHRARLSRSCQGRTVLPFASSRLGRLGLRGRRCRMTFCRRPNAILIST